VLPVLPRTAWPPSPRRSSATHDTARSNPCCTRSSHRTARRSSPTLPSARPTYRASCVRSSRPIVVAVDWKRGKLSQTKYYLSTVPATITIVRRHHPLEGQQLEVLSAAGSTVAVRLTDGSALKLPRRWTDAEGLSCTELSGDSPFTLQGLRELLRLFVSLRQRYRTAAAACDEKMDSPHDGAGGGDVQAKTIDLHRGDTAREPMGEISRVGTQRGHAALRPVDGANGGATHSPAETEAGGGQ